MPGGFSKRRTRQTKIPTVVEPGGNRGKNGIKKETHSLSDGIKC